MFCTMSLWVVQKGCLKLVGLAAEVMDAEGVGPFFLTMAMVRSRG